MKKEIAEKWIAALRSGKYKQGRACLQKGDQFCCLGVLCDILEIPRNGVDLNHRTCFGEFNDVSYLPREAVEISGMKNNSGALGAFDSLVKMNDCGLNFDQIADTIEEEWEKL